MGNYNVDSSFEEQINSFFKDLLLYPLQIDIAILNDVEYNKVVDLDTMAILFRGTVGEETKPKTSIDVAETVSNKIYVRKIGNEVNSSTVIHEFLHVYFPKLVEKKLNHATRIFDFAFRCYDKLSENQELRDFFVKLCRENGTLSGLANLPAKL
jgi:hypothetical protein